MIKLSKTSKMPCKSISLPIEETCKGRYKLNSKILKEICEKCYAGKGAYNWPPSVKLKNHNLVETRKHNFVPDMIAKMKNIKTIKNINQFRDFIHIDDVSKSIKRLIENTVFFGFITACLLASCPTRRSSFSVKATTEGVILFPSEFVITFG